MICPLCHSALACLEEQTCEDIYACDCEEGYVGMYVCYDVDCSISLVTITEDCKSCERK